MPSNAELRPCPNPSCPHGIPPSLDDGTWGHFVFCASCQMQGPAHTDEEEAIRLYNNLPRPGEERAAVVAWLREEAAKTSASSIREYQFVGAALLNRALLIETGDHLKEDSHAG